MKSLNWRFKEPTSSVEAFAKLRKDWRASKNIPDARQDYDATKTSIYRRNRTGYLATGSSADWHYRIQLLYLRMMEQARDMARNDSLIGAGIDRACDNLVNGQFRLSPRTGDAGLDVDLKAGFEDWAANADQVDLAGERDFYAMERAVPRNWMVDGDVMGVLTGSGHVEMIEGHRLRTPRRTTRNVVHGILMDDHRKRLEYWFSKDDVDPLQQITLVSDIERVPVRDKYGRRQVLHVYDPRRISQTRGVTVLAPVFDPSGMLEDILFSALVKQQQASNWCITRTPGPKTEKLPQFDRPLGPQLTVGDTGLNGGNFTEVIEATRPGMQVQLNEGEKADMFSPRIPSSEFFEHARLEMGIIAINLGLPLCVLMLDGSETNFSGWRGAIDEARKGFRRNQRILVERWHAPIYRWRCLHMAAADRIMQGRLEELGEAAFTRHRWHAPAWPYIEPLKDASADLLKLRNGLTSPRRLHSERGADVEEIVRETIDDNSMAIRAAKLAAAELNKEVNDGDPVHWREILSLPTPDGIKIQLNDFGDDNPARSQRGSRGGSNRDNDDGGE